MSNFNPSGPGRSFSQLTVRKITGRPALGFYRLMFSVEINIDPWPASMPITVSEIMGEVTVHANNNKYWLLGSMRPERPFVIEGNETPRQSSILFHLDLAPDQITALEELRNGGDLWFAFTFKGVSRVNNDTNPMSSSSQEFHINQRTWLDVLKEVGYGEHLLFEIPTLTGTNSSQSAKAIRALQKAREHFLNGHYDECVASCRSALDSVQEVGPLHDAKTAFCEDKESRRAMSVHQRVLLLASALRHMTHLAHHPEDSDNEEHGCYSRADATIALSTTAVLISRLSKKATLD